MKWLCVIALALAVAGCAGADYSPLQRDLAELAEMPKRLDTFVRERTGQQAQAGQPAQADLPAEGPVDAVATAPPVPVPAETVVAEAPTPDAEPVAPVAKAPTLLERLRMATAQQPQAPAAPPGPHDQIPEPIPVENPLARPPWEALAEAGPNADNELDLELLYGPGNVPAELQAEQPPEQAEQQVAVADMPLDLPAEGEPRVSADPPKAEPAKQGGAVIKSVAVPAVKGAKGTGNGELTEAMRNALKQAGWPVVAAPRKDALTVQGRVVIGKVHGANQSVKIVWDVLTPDGKKLGDLKQDNAVPAGSLDQSWGENAQYAAEAAAEGIFKLIQKYR